MPKTKPKTLRSFWIEQTWIDNLMSNDAKLFGASGACLALKGAHKSPQRCRTFALRLDQEQVSIERFTHKALVTIKAESGNIFNRFGSFLENC